MASFGSREPPLCQQMKAQPGVLQLLGLVVWPNPWPQSSSLPLPAAGGASWRWPQGPAARSIGRPGVRRGCGLASVFSFTAPQTGPEQPLLAGRSTLPSGEAFCWGGSSMTSGPIRWREATASGCRRSAGAAPLDSTGELSRPAAVLAGSNQLENVPFDYTRHWLQLGDGNMGLG